MEDSANGALFQVLVTLLSYTPAERQRMDRARQRRLKLSSTWLNF